MFNRKYKKMIEALENAYALLEEAQAEVPPSPASIARTKGYLVGIADALIIYYSTSSRTRDEWIEIARQRYFGLYSHEGH